MEEIQMAFCKHCGAELKEGAAFCTNCGRKVGSPGPSLADSNSLGKAPGYTSGNTFGFESGKTGEDYQKMLQSGMNAASSTARGFGDVLSQTWKRFLERCRADKKYAAAAGGVAAAVAMLLVVVFVSGQMGKRVHLEDCIAVEVSGYDTAGTAYAYLDEEAFARAVIKAKGGKTKLDPESYEWYEQLQELDVATLGGLVSLEIEKPQGLSNGDEVVVSISYDEERAKNYGVTFTGERYIYKVGELMPLQSVDPFANLSVWFEGIAPDLYLRYEYTGTDGLLSTYDFTADRDYGFTEGDAVTVSVNLTDEEVLNRGFQLSSRSKEYVCENIDTYIGSAGQLSETTLEQMKKDASDCIESYFSSHYDSMSYEDLTWEGCYVLIAKDSDRKSSSFVYVVSSASVASKKVYDYSNESRGILEGMPLFGRQTVFFPVAFHNIICRADGSAEYAMDSSITGSTDLSVDGWSSVAGYTNVRKMYNELAGSNKVNYDIEIVGNEEVLADGGSMEEAEDSAYILPTSSSEYLSMADLEGLTKEECRIARNEIYARYGRIFDDEALQAYFNGRDWYEGTIAAEDFDDDLLNEYETANRDLIVEYESDMGFR